MFQVSLIIQVGLRQCSTPRQIQGSQQLHSLAPNWSTKWPASLPAYKLFVSILKIRKPTPNTTKSWDFKPSSNIGPLREMEAQMFDPSYPYQLSNLYFNLYEHHVRGKTLSMSLTRAFTIKLHLLCIIFLSLSHGWLHLMLRRRIVSFPPLEPKSWMCPLNLSKGFSVPYFSYTRKIN